MLARYLLDLEMAEWQPTARAFMLYLAENRNDAWVNGEDDVVEDLDRRVYEHALHEQIPARWGLPYLFSEYAFARLGYGLFHVWAAALVHLCTLERYWVQIMRDGRPRDPFRLPGFHSDQELYSTEWLTHFCRVWSMELEHERPATYTTSDNVH